MVLFNPLVLLVINLVAPAFAAAMVHTKDYCGKTVCKLYTRLALKWPFKWAKWWITPDLLQNYTIDEQITYFRLVNSSEEALWKLSPEAWARLVKNNGYFPFECLAKGMKERNDLFSALLDLTVSEQKVRALIRGYMEAGTLPKTQAEILIEKACAESEKYASGVVGRILCEYIERCGISREMMENVTTCDKASEALKQAVVDSEDVYLQKLTTKRLFNMDTIEKIDEWAEFCASKKKISVAAQKEMSALQYQMFHRNGHRLDARAIMHMLWYKDKDFAEMIFVNEPQFGILNDKIDFILDKHDYLRPTLQEIIKEVEKDLHRRIYDRQELTEEKLDKMFDCPDSNDLALEYISHYPLPKALHKRLLEPKNEGALQFYISQCWLLSAYQLDTEVAEECKKRGYRLDPPEDA
ncbi:MAG: hypothetical protein IKR92_00070 [Alphaproteobacteria bacterium]|nr:hypothetical protein [Alphaproteobacteria bacterium]